MKRIPIYLKMRVIGALEYAAGETLSDRYKSVAAMTFKDEEGHAHCFTWRTIQTWWYWCRSHGIVEAPPRSDKDTTRKVCPEELLDAIEMYVDNGSNYSSKEFTIISARLGVQRIHTPVRDGAAKGKIERFFRTLRDQFLLRNLSQKTTLKELNTLFIKWVEDTYHQSEHTTLGMKPVDRFGMDLSRLRYLQLRPNEDIHNQVTYSVTLPALSNAGVCEFIYSQLDRVGLPHTTFSEAAVNLVARSSAGILRSVKNLCIGGMTPQPLLSSMRHLNICSHRKYLIQWDARWS